MASVVSYKGLTVVEGATGAGGQTMTANWKELADRAPGSFTTSGDPTVNDDGVNSGGNGVFYPFSEWLNDSTDTMFICINNATAAADWLELGESITEIVADTSPQLGGDLDMNGFNIEGITPTEMGYVSGVSSSIQTQFDDISTELVSDTSPQLGGNLDMNNFNIEGVTPTEMGYVSGVSSSIQDQIDNISSELVSDTSPQLGGNLDMNGFNIEGITPTEMGYVSGVSSSIQDQIDNISSDVVSDTSPQLGGDLDIQSFNIEGVNATRFGYLTTISSNVQDQLDGKSDTGHGHNEADIGDLGSYLENVVEDASPQLGGNLDMLTRQITTSTVNQDIIIEPNGTGAFQLASGGNARGSRAVDLQMFRDSASNVASGGYAAVGGGRSHTVSGAYSNIGGGRLNSVGTSYATIGGGRNNSIDATASYAVVCGGYNNDIDGLNFTENFSAIVGGNDNRIGSDASTADNDYCFIGGGKNNRIRNENSATNAGYVSIVGGVNNLIDGYCHGSIICTGEKNKIEHIFTAYHNFIGAGKNIRIGSDTNGGAVTCVYNFVGGGNANVIELGQQSSITGGGSNKIGENGSYAVTYSTICGGLLNKIADTATAAVEYVFIGGGGYNTVRASYAHIAGGFRGKATRYGESTHASGRFAADGDAQTMTFVLRNQTTDSTETELFLNGSSLRMTLDDQDAWTFSILIVGRQTNADNVSGGYKLEGVIDRSSTTTALVGSILKTTLGEDETAWDVAATADDANEALKITVTGADGDSVNWVARVDVAKANG